jgi:FkbM family methyltransferase
MTKTVVPKRIIDNHNIAIKNCKHGIFAYLINDQFIGKSLDLYGEWTESEIDMMSNFITPRSVVIDAGAFIGTHTIAFANMVGRFGFVYSFEPQRMIFNVLCGNVALNNLLNVKCLNMGLSDTPGKAFIPLLDPAVEQNFGALDLGHFGEGDAVTITTIDTLNLNGCNLIKVDVEGMEARVLKGAEITIKKYKPVLYVENNRVDVSAKTIKTVLGLGYRAYWHIIDYYNPKNFFGNKKNVFKNYSPEANMVCIPKNSNIEMKGFIEVTGAKDNWKEALKRLAKRQLTKI